MNQIH